MVPLASHWFRIQSLVGRSCSESQGKAFRLVAVGCSESGSRWDKSAKVNILGIGKAYKELWNTVKHSWGYKAARNVWHFVNRNPVAKAVWNVGKTALDIGDCGYALARSRGIDASKCNSF
jgi:hypothetical protein